MSTRNRSLVCEEIRGTNKQLVDLLPVRRISLSNASPDLQPASQVVKVSGNITVSF